MSKVKEINSSNVHQGDLVLVYHKDNPIKSGWYRLIADSSFGSRCQRFVLERPLHRSYTIARPNEGSCLNGMYSCSCNNFFINLKSERYVGLASAEQSVSCLLAYNNFEITCEIIHKLTCTDVGYAVLAGIRRNQGHKDDGYNYNIPAKQYFKGKSILTELIGEW